MDILSQEELDALFEVVKEPDKTISNSSSPPHPTRQIKNVTTGNSKKNTITWNWVQKRLLKRGSNIISSEEANAMEQNVKGMSALNRTPMAAQWPRVEIKKRLMKNIPFLVLLSEYGGALLNKKKELEINTRDDKKIKGYFEKFFFDEEYFKGGITINVDNEAVSINVTDIAVDEEGAFLIKTS